MKKEIVKFDIDGREVTIESGRLAKQADGSALVSSGNNVVLVTAVSSTRPSHFDFFPLTVEYSEKFYSTGKIPGGYFKREGRPSNEAILNCRLIDRPIRPCFPDGYNFETQLVATILSYDGQYPVNSLASIGASAALHLSDIPFKGPTASVKVVQCGGQLVANPNKEQLKAAELEMFIAGTRNGILMVEGGGHFVSEGDVLEALKFGHSSMSSALDAQDKLREMMGRKEKRQFDVPEMDSDFRSKANDFLVPKVKAALAQRDKMKRYAAFDEAQAEAVAALIDTIEDKSLHEGFKKDLNDILGDLKYDLARSMILDDQIRIDGRDMKRVRPIACEVSLLPRSHGSALFTRGETQVLGTVTLGTPDDEQMIDSLDGFFKKRFLLHYNFPPYCVGETGRMGGQSRREIGHGFLAEKALQAVLPDGESFPYTIRIVSEVLESNGSSSMGTVCSGTLAMLDAGVPIKGNVAGIAMGLISDGSRVAILSDILGDEDHLGDMDFKVAGTREGITALQMDIKIDSLTFDIMEKAMAQAKEGRHHILDEMEKVIKNPRGEISEFAPRIQTIHVKPDKVREVIGAGGKTIKGIIDETGVKINIEDDGKIHIASIDPEASQRAIEIIESICAEPEVGQIYKGKVVKVTDFGAFVDVLPNKSGLLHISEIAHERIRQVTDVLNEGDEVEVKILDVDRAGRIKLSRKALLEKAPH